MAVWLDIVVQSIQDVVPHHLAQLDESACDDPDKAKLFRRLSDFPDVNALVQQVRQVESQLDALRPSICLVLGLSSFNYSSVSGEEYLIQVDTSKAVPPSWIKIGA